jgi:hypothetical protein
MTTFDQRKDAFENKYKHEQELRFKAIARRNKLLGLWIAEKMGKQGEDALAYAREVVASDVERTHEEWLIEKVLADCRRAGCAVDAGDVKFEMDHLLRVAEQQVHQNI